MRHAISSSMLSLVMVATMMWGGCISCPQFFMFPTKASKGCCQKNGQCDRGSKSTPDKSAPAKECKRMPLEPIGSDPTHGTFVLAAELTTAVVVSPVIAVLSSGPHRETPVLEHSPPDLNVLHSTFLI